MLWNVRKNLIATVAVVAMSCGISAPARAGMPVIDVANLAQAIQQVLSWGQQLQAMAAHLQQLQRTYQSLTGPRGMQNLLPIAPGARNYLPADYSELMNVINGTSVTYPVLAGQVQGIIQTNAVLYQWPDGQPVAAGTAITHTRPAVGGGSSDALAADASQRKQ